MIDFTLFSKHHSETFADSAHNFVIIRKPVKPYGTGAHIVVPVQHAGKRCIVVVLED